MAKNAKTRAPFGIQTCRFANIGFHPALDPQGTMVKSKNAIGPGEYNPERFECAYKKYNIGGSRWKRKTDLEEFSQNLGFRFPEVLEKRRHYKSIGGPGTYDVPDDVYKKKSFTILENKIFGNASRFFQSYDVVPAPGTYDKDIIEASTVNKKQMTPKPTFEWDGFVDRFKRPSQPWMKAPNRYNPLDGGSIEARLSKQVSKRGPYDLFTGLRDGTTIKNHFAPPKKCAPDKFYTCPTQIDHFLHHHSKRSCGCFLKANRFPRKPTVRLLLEDIATCYRDPSTPSPATYDIQVNSIKKASESLYPFDDSVAIARKGVRWDIKPGPARYDVKFPKSKDKKKQSWVFKSKTMRQDYKPPKYSIFE